MNGEELMRRRLRLGYSLHGLAEILRAQPASFEEWESGEVTIPQEIEDALNMIESRHSNGACDLVIL